MSMFVEIPVVRSMYGESGKVQFLAIKHGCVVAGGYARWCCSPRANPASFADIDILTMSMSSHEEMCDELESVGYKVVARTNRAVTFTVQVRDASPVQVIFPESFGGGDLKEQLSQFDFSVSMVALVSSRTGLAHTDFLNDERQQILRVCGFRHIQNCIGRVARYAKKGYMIRTGEQRKLLKKWDSLSEAERKLRLDDVHSTS